MGYEDEMDEYYDEQIHRKMNKSFVSFKRKNIVSCKEIPFRTLIWSYICWVLAGKPNKRAN